MISEQRAKSQEKKIFVFCSPLPPIHPLFNVSTKKKKKPRNWANGSLSLIPSRKITSSSPLFFSLSLLILEHYSAAPKITNLG